MLLSLKTDTDPGNQPNEAGETHQLAPKGDSDESKD